MNLLMAVGKEGWKDEGRDLRQGREETGLVGWVRSS